MEISVHAVIVLRFDRMSDALRVTCCYVVPIIGIAVVDDDDNGFLFHFFLDCMPVLFHCYQFTIKKKTRTPIQATIATRKARKARIFLNLLKDFDGRLFFYFYFLLYTLLACETGFYYL